MIHSCLASGALLPSECVLFAISYLQTHRREGSHPAPWSTNTLRVTQWSLHIAAGGNQGETYRHRSMKALPAYLCLRKYIFT